MITKLDHFSRSTIDAIKTGMKLFKKGVQTHILNIGLVEDTHPTRRLVFNVRILDTVDQTNTVISR